MREIASGQPWRKLQKIPARPAARATGWCSSCRDNAARRLFIASSNDIAAATLGYARGELDGHDLDRHPGQGRHRHVRRGARIRRRRARFRRRACPPPRPAHEGPQRRGDDAALHRHARRLDRRQRPRFQLVLPNEREQRAKQQLRDFLKLNLDGRAQLDAATRPARPRDDRAVHRAAHQLPHRKRHQRGLRRAAPRRVSTRASPATAGTNASS
ncbi:MAG: hypothetical protein WDN72_06215 [Alphaproteobacteria bacterium]